MMNPITYHPLSPEIMRCLHSTPPPSLEITRSLAISSRRPRPPAPPSLPSPPRLCFQEHGGSGAGLEKVGRVTHDDVLSVHRKGPYLHWADPGIIKYLEIEYFCESLRNKTGTGGVLLVKQLTPVC